MDSAIELSGNDRALHEAVRSVVVDGTVVASGFYQGGAEHLRLGEEFHHNRVRIVASQIGGTPVALGPRWDQPRLVRTFMDQVRRGRVDARSLVTDVVEAADVAAVFERLDRGDPAILQAVLRFPAAPEAGVIVDTAPRFPADRSGVAILGCGTIAQSAHLPAYEQYGVGVTGVWSRRAGDHRPRAGHGSRSSAGSTPPPRTCWPTRRCATSTSPPVRRAGWTGSRRRWRRASTCWPRSRSPCRPTTWPGCPPCWTAPRRRASASR